MRTTGNSSGGLAESDGGVLLGCVQDVCVCVCVCAQVKKWLKPYVAIDEDFEDLRQDLNGVFVEAKDNVRFLSTLERHLKNITYGSDFKVSFTTTTTAATDTLTTVATTTAAVVVVVVVATVICCGSDSDS